MNKTIADFQAYKLKVNKERSFDNTTVPEMFLFLSEEVGEMAKASRQLMNLEVDSKSDKHELAHEVADVFSYLLDIANKFDIDLEKAFWEKEEINNNRVWGKKGEQ